MDNDYIAPESDKGGSYSGKHSFSLYEKVQVSDKQEYVLGLSGADDGLATSQADMTVKIFKFTDSSITPLNTIKAHEDTITDIKFFPENKSMLYTSSKDSTIRTWDLRTGIRPVQSFTDSSKGCQLSVNCFDFDPSSEVICGGTDKLAHDAFLLFWDRRSSCITNSYSESHTDDVTVVRYHPERTNLMISGSVDGLINIFDQSQSTEDDALQNTINTESSVEKLNWTESNKLVCLTHTEEMQIWDSDDVSLVSSCSRESLKNVPDIDYLVDVVQFPESKELLLLTGTSKGHGYIWSIEKEKFSVWSVLAGGHSDIIRCKTVVGDKIVTGGEDGFLCLWQKDVTQNSKKTLGVKQKHGNHQKKPY